MWTAETFNSPSLLFSSHGNNTIRRVQVEKLFAHLFACLLARQDDTSQTSPFFISDKSQSFFLVPNPTKSAIKEAHEANKHKTRIDKESG